MRDLGERVWPETGIDFVPSTPRWGNAEFVFCLRYERGKLRRVFVSAMQQEENGSWVYEVPWTVTQFSLHNYAKFRDEIRVWIGGWCEQHKCQFIRLYVPKSANHLNLKMYSESVSIEFRAIEQEAGDATIIRAEQQEG